MVIIVFLPIIMVIDVLMEFSSHEECIGDLPLLLGLIIVRYIVEGCIAMLFRINTSFNAVFKSYNIKYNTINRQTNSCKLWIDDDIFQSHTNDDLLFWIIFNAHLICIYIDLIEIFRNGWELCTLNLYLICEAQL